MHPTPARRALSALAALLLVTWPAASAAAVDVPAAVDDPALDQTLDADLEVVDGPGVLETGHVDMGPRFVDGSWRLLVHDDAARTDPSAASVWRTPERTVLRVVDAAVQQVPDDPAYAFVGAEPGADVWVVPQTQDPDVVWLGWNTQDPEVMASVDRGVTLGLRGVQGPGTMTVYLQSGTFGAPQVLWDSRAAGPQDVWVDVNTHTHASWVFTAPGVYLVQVEVAADLLDGSRATDTQVLRVAVGSATSTDEAAAATWQGPAPTAAAAAEPGAASTEDDGTGAAAATGATADAPLVPLLVGAVAVVGAGLLVAVLVVATRAARDRRRAFATTGPARPEDTGPEDAGPDAGPDAGHRAAAARDGGAA